MWADFSAGIAVGPATGLAIAAVLVVVFLLYRGLTDLRVVTAAMWCSVMALMAWIVLTGAVRGHLSQAFTLPAGRVSSDAGVLSGAGLGHDVGDLRLLGLLQHHVSGRRGEGCGAHGAARDPDLDCAGGGDLPGDEHLGAGGAAVAGAGGGTERRRSIESRRAAGGDLDVYGGGVWAAAGAGAGQSGGGTGDDDGVLRRVLAAAGLLAHSLRGGAGRQLLPHLRQVAPEAAFPMFRC